jgi:hypothetical protein
MKSRCSKVVAVVLVVTLLSTLLLSCGGDSGVKTIVIGLVTDMTGPAASFLPTGEKAIYDSVTYINEEDPIPGVQLKVVAYDSRYDPSRDIPAYEWLKERGAALVYSGIPTFGDTIRSRADREEYSIIHSAPTEYQLMPPGYVFGLTPPISWVAKGFLKWISEEDWDYEAEGRKPKIGSVGWDEPYHMDVTGAIYDYVTANPDDFEYVDGLITPMGNMSWYGEVEALKDCDYIYIPSTGLGTATFAKDYRDRGYDATYIGLDAMSAFLELLVDKAGWDYLDGSLTAHTTLHWNDDFPIVDKAKDFLSMYHSGEEEEIMNSGIGYISVFFCAQFTLDLIRQAIEDAGADNFDSKAFYETATGFTWNQEGLPERGYGFSDTVRWARKDLTVYQWQADAEELVRISGWIPGDVA